MKDKLTIILGIGITAFVVFSFVYYMIYNETIDQFNIIAIIRMLCSI